LSHTKDAAGRKRARSSSPWHARNLESELTEINNIGDRVGVLVPGWEGTISVKRLIIGIAAAPVTTGASAQSVNLTGTYRCVQMCRGDVLAYSRRTVPSLIC
jgi:hypothetical protein